MTANAYRRAFAARKQEQRFPIRRAAAFIVIIRATHMRGEDQAEALAELARRGLWLNEEQKKEAGI